MDVDTEDNMPQKVCSNCRILLEKIYVFRGKSYENDQALRKLVNANSSEVRHTEEFLQEDETSYSSHMPIVNVNVEVNESDENDFGDEETTMDDDLGDNSEHYSINIIDDSEMTGDPGSKPFIKQENQLNHNNKEQPEEFYQISTTVKTEKLDQVLESTMKSLGYDGQFTYSVSSISNDGMQTVKVQKSDGSIVNVAARLIGNWLRHPGDESDLLKTIMLPVTFPVKCGSDVHRLEAWISDNKLNYDKLIYVLRRRFAASPDPFSALKNLFLYSIAFDFVHPSGHRKGNMTLISDMRVFTEALEGNSTS